MNGRVSDLQNLYIVADGMGGHNAGEIASKTAVEVFYEYVQNRDISEDDTVDALTEAANFANTVVYTDAQEDKNCLGMGTTFTALTIIDNIKVRGTHVGDSRVYLINENGIELMTKDHTYVQMMLQKGQITKEEAKGHPRKNVLTKALGVGQKCEMDAIIFDIKDGDKVLMCTDGLSNMITDDKIFEIVTSNNLETATEVLINTANQNGGTDNITLILIGKDGEQ